MTKRKYLVEKKYYKQLDDFRNLYLYITSYLHEKISNINSKNENADTGKKLITIAEYSKGK